MGEIKKVISIIGAKGGTGKTTIAVLMSYILAKNNIKVLLVDCDVNTFGATIFCKITNLISLNSSDIVTINKILQSEINFEIFKERLEDTDWREMKVTENFNFIPAVEDSICLGLIEDLNANKNLKKILDNLVEQWSKRYQVIIFDHSAGYNNLINVLASISTELFLIREPNNLSLEAARTLYEKLHDFKIPIKGCINKIPDIPKVSVETIVQECIGLKYDEKIVEKATIEEICNEYREELERIVSCIFPEFTELKKKYLMDLEQQEKQKRIKEKQKKYEEWEKYFKLFNKMFFRFCTMTTIIIVTIVKIVCIFIKIEIDWIIFPASLFVLVMVLVIGLGGVVVYKKDAVSECKKYYYESLCEHIGKSKDSRDEEFESDENKE